MPDPSYHRWRYPKSSRKLDKFIFTLLLISIPFILYFHKSLKKISENELEQITGSLEDLQFLTRHGEDNTARLTLKEYPDKTFVFDMRGFGTIGSPFLKKGDTLTVRASMSDIKKNYINISSYGLAKKDFLIFSVASYNSSVTVDRNMSIAIVLIAIALFSLYLILKPIIRKRKVIPRLKKLMKSPDTDFEPPNRYLNFNEFLDDNSLDEKY
ncbi:MAG TPA: hypothetical protein PLU37_00750 [Chitinophagaceae bacterium]|nr:hypothetical protein [Chitinophagales bacterium]HPG10026.1 hypothetical protein [Chitinophagaceae bacterium]